MVCVWVLMRDDRSDAGLPLDATSAIESLPCSASIGADQTAHAQFCATPISRHDDGGIDKVSSGELRQDRTTRGSTRLAIIAHTVDRRSGDPPRPAMVAGVGQLARDLDERGLGLILVRNRHNRCDESRSLGGRWFVSSASGSREKHVPCLTLLPSNLDHSSGGVQEYVRNRSDRYVMSINTFARMLILVAAFLGLAILATACASDGPSAETAGVASVDDLDASTIDAASAAATEASSEENSSGVSAEESGLLLSACMRENGYADFPDPTFDSEGNLNLRDAITSSGIDFRDQTVREQLDLCREEAGADNFGAGGARNGREGIQEQLLVYTDCLRSEGLDVGDLEFGGGAQGQGQAQGGGADDAPQQGQAQGNGGAGGDRGDRIANALGLDVDDPDTGAALDACQGTLEEALAGFGAPRGAPTAPASNDS
ncbi:MAG: hypothetical protein ACI81L_001802 [Verrucomicrobiales bacterium]|jgi:hypothetical protein